MKSTTSALARNAAKANGRQKRNTPKSGSTRAKKRGPYVSKLMIERRRRMIDVAKVILAEKGAEGFTIRELTEKAGVSITIVYSTYGDKEGLIVSAIEDFYDKLPVAHELAPTTLPGLLAKVEEASRTILENSSYSRALVDLYFSRTADKRVFSIIRNMAINTFAPWLDQMTAEKATVPGLSLETMRSALANDRWSVILDWACGRIADEDLARGTKVSFLITAAGLTTGSVRGKIDIALRKILHDQRPKKAQPRRVEG